MLRCLSSSSSTTKSEAEEEGSSFSEIVLRVAAQTMSCFFGCFRVKDSSPPVSAPAETVVVSRNRNANALSSLFVSDDESVGTGERGRRKSVSDGIDFSELKDEAKFLKACGTLPETPVEIRKGTAKWESISPQNGEDKSSKFNMEKLSDESLITVQICEESASRAGSLEETPSSCMTDGHNTRRGSISSAQSVDTKNVTESADACDSEMYSAASSFSPVVSASSLQGRKKYVHFESDFDSAFSSKDSSYESVRQTFSRSCGSDSVSKPSSDLTPVKLAAEMQKLGTVSPAYMSNDTVGKPNRIGSQDVCSVYDLFENNSDLKGMKAEISDSKCPTESTLLNDSAIKNDIYGKQSSLVNKEQFGSFSGENLVHGRTPGDRPILGMVAAHWKDDEDSRTSPIVWDGNGIPNSTNKYKEDQKVRFHATPFEERLEKALSEGSFVSQRNPISGTLPVTFEENEESDTALSHSRLESSAHFKSVVSF